MRCLLALLLCVLADAVEVRLASPLNTLVDLAGEFSAQDGELLAQVSVPEDAPDDLRVVAFAQEDGGAWRQSPRSLPLAPGVCHIALAVPGRPGAESKMRSVAGLLFCSARQSRARLVVDAVRVVALPAEPRRTLVREPGEPHLDPPSPPVQARPVRPEAGAGRSVALAAPLRTCLGSPLADGCAGCVVTASLHLGADAPNDLTVGAYARDAAGRWRQADQRLAVHPGVNEVRLHVPPGIPALPGERGAGEAGLVFWSAQTSHAVVLVRAVDLAATPAPAVAEACLDRLRVAGASATDGGLRVEVGSTWSASVVPSPPDGDGVRFSLAAEVTDLNGRVGVVTGTVEASGRHRLDFYPCVPGSVSVRLIGNWSNGRRVAAPLPNVTVTGAHPCPDGTRLAVRGPLATTLRLPETLRGASQVVALILVPDGSPRDLAVGAIAYLHGDRWFQSAEPQALVPGLNRLRFDLALDSAMTSSPAGNPWNADALETLERAGLIFTTASTTTLPLICQVQALPLSQAERPALRLLDLASATVSGTTGERWSLTLRPDPFPTNPFDPEDFRLDLHVTTPEGTTLVVPGFYGEDMHARDRGDRETLRPADGGFHIRYRPRTPGLHRLELRATWHDGGASRRLVLPELQVSGRAWDGYARIDAKDPRFFAVDGRFFWPVGPNLRSVWDLRGQERTHTKLTPDRGTLAYDAFLKRFAAAGANACEIWMCAWNLALEWRADWPGFGGVGRYNQDNAWRLDRILDTAWALGVRVNLVINNHGQASQDTDAEWANNPYNTAAGGLLASPIELFRDPRALAGQEKLRRYLIARYADHPAVLGWKLWTEINLTQGGAELRPWHEQAVARWHALDPYAHPVASHWSGDYRSPSEDIVRLLDYVCIDAYHNDEAQDPYRLVHRLLRDSTLAPNGLARFVRPVLVTEYGGNWSGTRTDALMVVDHSCGAWVAFVTGHAGAPMLWWFEWIDQGNRFAPYGAIRRFTAGEDLRGDGTPASVRAEQPSKLWTAAWRTRARLFGYVIDERWAEDGTTTRPIDARLIVDAWPGGTLTCEWWDPDAGTLLSSTRIDHRGGPLKLSSPAFRKHLAWKIR